MNPDHCIECDNIVVKVPLINGDELTNWCSDHLAHVRKAASLDLGQEVFNFLFKSFKHDIWFWGSDIRAALSMALDVYFTARSEDIYDTMDDGILMGRIHDSAEILKIKAGAYEGAIEMALLGTKENADMVALWISKKYWENIGAPLGAETKRIANKYFNVPIPHEAFNHIVCMVLSAKRAEGYIGHRYERHLIGIETALWGNHRQHIN